MKIIPTWGILIVQKEKENEDNIINVGDDVAKEEDEEEKESENED